MTKFLDGTLFSIAVIAIVLALPSVIWGAFWLMYSFWHFLGVM
jgi:hypothetical protein